MNWQRRQLSQHVALCDIYQGQTPSQNCVPARLFVRGSIHFQQLAQVTTPTRGVWKAQQKILEESLADM